VPTPAPRHTVPATAALAAGALLAREPEPTASPFLAAFGPERCVEPIPRSASPSAPTEAARSEPGAKAQDLDRALHRAWYARLRPADPAELAAVDALVAGVSRRRRLDRLEERVLEALADGTMDSLRVLAALARCRARIERDRRLLLEELRLLRDPARLPLRTPRPQGRADRIPAASRRATPEPVAAGPVVADPLVAEPPPPASADRPSAPFRMSQPAPKGTVETAARGAAAGGPANGTAPRQAAPEPRSAGRLELLPQGAFAPDPLALAVAEAFPSRRRDFDRLPDWRERSSAFALEVGRMAAGCGRAVGAASEAARRAAAGRFSP